MAKKMQKSSFICTNSTNKTPPKTYSIKQKEKAKNLYL